MEIKTVELVKPTGWIPLGAILAIVDPVVIVVSKFKLVLRSLLESQLCLSLELRKVTHESQPGSEIFRSLNLIGSLRCWNVTTSVALTFLLGRNEMTAMRQLSYMVIARRITRASTCPLHQSPYTLLRHVSSFSCMIHHRLKCFFGEGGSPAAVERRRQQGRINRRKERKKV
ncbi:hypothetical protein JHK87_006333 [Glycine soja]|nr:hypothetical protein JHK87_006333 [Glycine soja]